MKLISLSQFKKMAEIADSTEEGIITAVLEWISGAMEKALDRWLVKAQYVEVLRPEGSVAWIKAYPVDLAAAMTVTDYGQVLASDEIYVDAERGKITRINGLFMQYNYPTLRVAYTGGYPQEGVKEEQSVLVPDDLKLACYLQSMYYWKNRKDLGLNTISMAGESVSIAPVEWLPAVKAILATRKRILLA